MASNFGYRLSYFRPGEPSSIDIWVNTGGQTTHGLQIVADIESDPLIEILDQQANLPELQLSVENTPSLSFITNKVTKTDQGYRLAVAAITSNPQIQFQTSGELVVAKLIFQQSSSGQISVKLDENLTKMPIKGGGEIKIVSNPNSTPTFSQENLAGSNVTQAVTGSVSTQQENSNSVFQIETKPIGGHLQLLTGENMLPPADPSNQQEYFQNIDQSFEASKSWQNQNNLMIGFGTIFVFLAIFVWMRRFKKKRI